MDDTNIFFTGHNPIVMKDAICRELTKLYAWFSANKLSLNVSKTNYIVFCNKKGIGNVTLENGRKVPEKGRLYYIFRGYY